MKYQEYDTYIKNTLLPDVAEEISRSMDKNFVDIVPYEFDPRYDILCGRCCYRCNKNGIDGIFVLGEAPCTIYEQYGKEKIASNDMIYVFEAYNNGNVDKFNAEVLEAKRKAELKAREILKNLELVEKAHS